MLLRESIECIAKMAQQACGLDNLMVYQSGKQEFLDMLKSKVSTGKLDAYPFVFINENTITQVSTKSLNDVQVKIGEIVIATLTDPTYSANDRDKLVFEKILNPFKDEFIKTLDYGQAGIVLMDQGDSIKKPFYGRDENGNPFSDSVDAYQLTNLKIRIL